MKRQTFHDLNRHRDQDLYSAEEQVVATLPAMATAAADPDLAAVVGDGDGDVSSRRTRP